MTTAFVHIGLPHSASSHIEYFMLDSSYVESLAPSGLQMVQPLGKAWRKAYLEDPQPGVMTDALKRCRDKHVLPLLADDKPIIFSEEHFTDPEKYPEMVPHLQEFLEGFDVKVILVVRRQDRWLESRYSQHVKDGGTTIFSSWLKQQNLDDYHWLDYADAYYDEYPTVVLPLGANRRDIMVDLFAVMGIAMEYEPVWRVNPSLPSRFTEALRCANVALRDKGDRKVLADVMVEHLVQTPGEGVDFFTNRYSSTTRDQIVEHYKEKNEMLFEKYLPDHAVY